MIMKLNHNDGEIKTLLVVIFIFFKLMTVKLNHNDGEIKTLLVVIFIFLN